MIEVANSLKSTKEDEISNFFESIDTCVNFSMNNLIALVLVQGSVDVEYA